MSSPPSRRTADPGAVVAALGVLLIAARLILPAIPGLFVDRVSLNTAHGICDSGLGVMARSFDKQAAAACGHADAVMTWLTVAAALGVVLVVAGGLLLARQRAGARTRPEAQPTSSGGLGE